MFRPSKSLRSWLGSTHPKPALLLGIRTAIASVVPLFIAAILQEPILNWAALGGFYACLADVGGAYRIKATSICGVVFLGALSLGLGVLLGGLGWLSSLPGFFWGWAGGYLYLYGNVGSMVGMLVSITFFLGLGVTPHTLLNGGLVALSYFLGGLGGMVLILALWPVYPYQPLRRAVSRCYALIAADVLQNHGRSPSSECLDRDEWRLYHSQRQITEALGEARAILAATRWRRQGTSSIEESMAILIQMAEYLSRTIKTLGELWAEAPQEYFQNLWTDIDALRVDIGDVLNQVAIALKTNHQRPHIQYLQAKTNALRQDFEQEKLQDHDWQQHYGELLAIDYILHTLEDSQTHCLIALEALGQDTPKPESVRDLLRNVLSSQDHSQPLKNNVPGWLSLRSNLTLDSLFFRHGLRFGITVAIAIIFYNVSSIPQGTWIPLTIAVILKPYAGDTFDRLFQRVGGTVAGAILGILLVSLIDQPLMAALMMAPLTILMMALLKINYGLYVLFLTPWVVLMDNIYTSGNWQIAVWRIVNTLIGSILVLAANYVLFPRWECQNFPHQLAKTIEANRRLFQETFAIYLGQSARGDRLNCLNQKMRLTMANTHASFQRYLGEGTRSVEQLERFQSIMIYNQRFEDALLILQTHHYYFSGIAFTSTLEHFVANMNQVLEDLALALHQGTTPPALPNFKPLKMSLQHHLANIQQTRAQELNQGQTDTPLKQTVLDHALPIQEINRLIHHAIAMHRAIAQGLN